MPIRVIAKYLVEQGYDVTFVCSNHYRKAVEDIGCTFVPINGYGDYYEGELETRWPERNSLPPGPIQLAYDIENCFVKAIPSQHEALQVALKCSRKTPWETHCPGERRYVSGRTSYL